MNSVMLYRWFAFAIGVSIIIHCLTIFAFIKSDVLNIKPFTDKTIIAKLVSTKTQKYLQQDANYKSSKTDEQDNPVSKENGKNDTIPQAPLKEDVNNVLKSDKTESTSTTDEQKVRLEVPKLNDNIYKGFQGYSLKIDSYMTSPKTQDKGIALLKYNREELHYNIYWVGIHVGSARLSAKRHLTDMVIQSEVHSNKFISNFYKVEDYAKSTIVNGRPHRFRIKQIEGKYKSDKETIFDYSEGQITFIDYLKNKQMGHTVKDVLYWDVISGFYYLRSMPVFDTNKIFVDVFDSNKFIKVQVVILGRETIERISGEDVETIKAKIIIHTEGLFKKVGDIIIWLSDDVDRIPLRVETKVPVGKVTAELSKIQRD